MGKKVLQSVDDDLKQYGQISPSYPSLDAVNEQLTENANKQKTEQINVLYPPKDYPNPALKGDGTDETVNIQKFFDYYANTGTVLFFPKTVTSYAATKIGLKNGVSILSNGAKFTALASSETKFMYVAEQGQINNVLYKGFKVDGKSLNAGQNGMDFTAVTQTSGAFTGGLWYSILDDIQIYGFQGIQLKLSCTDVSGDMANQFLSLNRVVATRNAGSTSRCLYLEGQLGQTVFTNCEFDGPSSEASTKPTGTLNVEVRSLQTGNDQIGLLQFNNCTFQNSEKAFLFYYVFDCAISNCWFENLAKAIDITSTSNVTVKECHFANAGNGGGSGYLISNGIACKVSIGNNYNAGTTDKLIVGNSHNGVSYFGQFFNASSTITTSGVTPQLGITSSTLTLNNNRHALVNASNNTLATITSGLVTGEEITLIAWGVGNTITVNGTGNIALPNRFTQLQLQHKDTINLIKADLGVSWIIKSTTGVFS